jgi:GT2 family glycosyltransferase
MSKLSVILVNWNAGTELLDTLHALYQALAALSDFEVILIDNASTDGSAQTAAQKFPALTVIYNSTNLGFGAANNLGFAHASGRYILLVNPDLRMNSAALHVLLGFMETHPQAGTCGPKVLEADSATISPWCARRDPHPWDVFCEYAFLTKLFPRRRLFSGYVLGDWDHASNCEVNALTGACLLVRREVIEQIGGLDERFFMYGEDLDWCRRIRRRGWQVWYVAAAEVQHQGAHSTRQIDDRGSRWSLESYLRYFRTWGSGFELLRARLALSSGNLIRALIWLAIAVGRPRQFRYAVQRAAHYFHYTLLAWTG